MTDRILSAAIYHTCERSIVYASYGRHQEADAYTYANGRLHREQLVRDGRYRCVGCGFDADDHDFDGACPSSEDDALFHRAMNAPA